jgi:hypothetical protein
MCETSSIRLRRWNRGLLLAAVGIIGLLAPTSRAQDGQQRVAPAPFAVHLVDSEGKNVPGVLVKLGGRSIASGQSGQAIFDGLPAGTYQLDILQDGWNRLTRTVDVPPGHRKKLKLPLTRQTLLNLKGKVLAAETDLPVENVDMLLTPRKVAAGVQGPLYTSTGIDGKFVLTDLPAGVYDCNLTAPGYVDRVFPVKWTDDAQEIVLHLKQDATPHSLRVLVRESQGGKGIAGATVTLAEAYPKGIVAIGTTDAGGNAALEKIPVGLCNEPDAKGKLVVSRPQLGLHIRASGYATNVTTVDLSRTRAITVHLDRVRTLAHAPGNEALAGARQLPPGSKAETKIDQPKRARYFRFDLTHKAIVTARLEKALDHSMRVEILDPTGKQLAQQWTDANQSPTVTVSLSPGRYFIRVSATSPRASTDKTMILSLQKSLTADAFEPNETPGGASVFRPGQTVRGYITDPKDVDVYRVEVPRPGWSRFHCPGQKFEPHLALFDAKGKKVRDFWNYTGRPINLDYSFPAAGTYYLHVAEAGRNNCSVHPYEVRFYFVGNDHEALGGGRTLRTIEPNSLIAGNIAPKGEQDRYLISLPSAGRVTVRARGPLEIELGLYDLNGKKLTSAWNYTGRITAIGWDVASPTTLVLKVNEAGNNNWSPSPYVCRATFEPCDEYERTGRNDTPATATPLDLREVIRGNISPLRDVDYYRFVVDHPGYLTVKGIEGVELHLTAYDASGKELASQWNYLNRPTVLAFEADPGQYLLRVNEAGNNNWSVHPYRIQVLLHRAAPYERTPLATESRRALGLHEARSVAFEHLSDTDRFRFAAPKAGTYSLRGWSSSELHYIVTDARTGKKVADRWFYAGFSNVELKCEGPTLYNIDIHEAGRNHRSNAPGFVMVTDADVSIQACGIETQADPVHPTHVTFTRKPLSRMNDVAKIEIDADGDGKFETVLDGQSTVVRYPAEGRYTPVIRMTGKSGQTALLETWAIAQGPRQRKGVYVNITRPAQDQVVSRNLPCLISAMSYEAAGIRRVHVAVDGQPVGTAYRMPYSLEIPWQRLGAGKHEITAWAEDARGNRDVCKRTVTLSAYFNLQPEDGAVLSGNAVRVSWFSQAFAPARLQYRKAGTRQWQQVTGQAGREKVLLLEDLEPGVEYEIQPLGGPEPGPIRHVTRVKGLAFGQSRYATTIQRNYDQRMGVTVRNHADKPMQVVLEADQPKQSKLLVAFVSAGEPKTAFTLEPGQQRQFTLGFSAQDVVKPLHKFNIRIRSDSGYADQAEVEVRVKLPEVKFAWEPIEEQRNDMSRRFRLHNRGDTITDLSIRAAEDSLIIDPQMQHGMLRRGETLTVTVSPKFHDRWRETRTELIASCFDKRFAQPVHIALPAGEQMYKIPLLPGLDPLGGETEESEDILAARALAGAWLDPETVDWTPRNNPQDTDGDMQPDRWEFADPINHVVWLGDDTDADGTVDFVHADLGGDGQFEYSALRGKDGWEQTNLVDAWLEMNFSVPKHRSQYEPHDIDLVLNGKVVARIEQSIPEGNYSFRLPPSALNWTQTGTPGDNRLEIRSHFMNYAHYAITSDFQFKARLTSGAAWMPGISKEDAYRRLLETNNGLTLAGADYSVSSDSVRIEGPEKLKKADEVVVRAQMRNLGAAAEEFVPVALFRAVPGTEGIELARTYVEPGALTRPVPVRLRWNVAAGQHSLRIVVDPDRKTSDTNRRNNTAIYNITVPGDDAPPELEILSPKADSQVESNLVELAASADDDGGVARLEVQIDSGLFVPLDAVQGRYKAQALLQPGKHRLTFRALDGAGNLTVEQISIDVQAERPELSIESPAASARIDARRVQVAIRAGQKAQYAAVRVTGAPWQTVALENGSGTAELVLPFGQVRIEAMAVGPTGIRNTAEVALDCTVQPSPDGQPQVPLSPVESVLLSGIGPDTTYDPLGPANQVLRSRSMHQPPRSDAGKAAGGTVEMIEPAPVEAQGSVVYFRSPVGTAVSRSGRIAGGISVHRHHKDWYCPNRPNIQTKFRLPDWLRKLDLSKYPPGSEEYKKLQEKLLDHLRRRGIDTSKLEKFRDILIARAGRLEQAGDLPDFWQSLGFKAMPPDDPEARKAWREKMKRNTQMFWLRLLASGDPRLIAQGLQARAEAMGKFDEALREHAQAAIDTVNASQQLAEDVVESSLAVGGVFFPPVAVAGELLDVYAALSGRTMLADRQVGALERFLRGAGSIGVRGMEQAYKRSAAVRKAADGLYRFTAATGEAGKEFLKRNMPGTSKFLGSATETVTEVLTKQRRVDFWRASKTAQQAGEVFDSTAKGIEAAGRMARDEGAAKALLKRFEDASDPDVVRQLVRKGQSNKTFQRIINEAADDATKIKFNSTVKGWYDQADKITGSRIQQVLKQTDEAKFNRIAQQMGVDPGQLRKLRDKVNQSVRNNTEALEKLGVQVDGVTVEPMFITRPRKGVKVGRDRDVTYFIYANTPDGGKIMVGEIHHDISRRIYQQEFYRAAMNADDVPRLANGLPDHKAVDHFNGNLDQAVTSSMDLEAYNVGEVELRRFFNQGNDPSTITRIEDLRDTVKHKSNEWFERAAHASDPIQKSRHVVEGMRQSHKQFDDMIVARLKQYGLDPKVAVPGKLQVGMDVFKQASSGKISAEKAAAMLAENGLTPQQVSDLAADFFEGVEKTAGKAFRAAGTADLTRNLQQIRQAGGSDWAQQSLRKINTSLGKGRVSGAVFREARTKVFADLNKQMLSQPGGGARWTQWVREAYQQGLINLKEARQLL